jgi:predicted nucleic acid-binding protein
MSVPDFLDTNIFVYAYETHDPRKQKIAQGLVESALAGNMMVSTQVLNELAATLLHKFSPKLPPTRVVAILDALSSIAIVTLTLEIIQRAVEAHAAYGVRFYDGMIIASAERAGCKRVWSEDLNAGQEYFGVTVVNPFV